MKDYLIKYTIRDRNGTEIKSGTIRVKNKMNELVARVKFEEWIKKKYPSTAKVIVHSCYEDNEINRLFGGIFKT